MQLCRCCRCNDRPFTTICTTGEAAAFHPRGMSATMLPVQACRCICAASQPAGVTNTHRCLSACAEHDCSRPCAHSWPALDRSATHLLIRTPLVLRSSLQCIQWNTVCITSGPEAPRRGAPGRRGRARGWRRRRQTFPQTRTRSATGMQRAPRPPPRAPAASCLRAQSGIGYKIRVCSKPLSARVQIMCARFFFFLSAQ